MTESWHIPRSQDGDGQPAASAAPEPATPMPVPVPEAPAFPTSTPNAEQASPYRVPEQETAAAAPPLTQHPAPRRGPGWTGVIGVGAASALAASLLTANWMGPGPGGPQGLPGSLSSVSEPAAPGPVTTGLKGTPDWVAVAKATGRSVVAVQFAGTDGNGGEGSGVVLDTAGNILTNNHVVADAANGGTLNVVFSNGNTYEASIVGRDPQTDLAVLRVKQPPKDLTPIAIGNSDEVRVGDPVMAVGNPLGLADTVTTGIVSAMDRPVTTGADNSPDQAFTNAIQTDAAINPGNSGGALVDVQGRLIGINSSIAALSAGGGQAGSIGLGFAIPVNEARDVAKQLIDKGQVAHAFLGVSLGDATVEFDGARRNVAEVAQVTNGGPAAQAGVKTGDAIAAIDGQAILSRDALVAAIRERRPDTEVKLSVVRGGKVLDIPVRLGTRPTQ